MCNRYRIDPRRARRIRRDIEDWDSATEIPREIFPDGVAPVVLRGANGLRAETMRWGFPSPQEAGRPVANARNLASPFWRDWLAPAQRCLLPATSYCEWSEGPPKIAHWFGLDASEPMFAFAGLWRPWSGPRAKINGDHRLFAILTVAPNATTRPIHAKSMPVILFEEDWERWLSAPIPEALAMAQPLADDAIRLLRADPPPPRKKADESPTLF